MVEKRHILTFVKSKPPYNAGESAGFAPKTAAKLLAAGLCVPAASSVITKAHMEKGKIEPLKKTRELAKRLGKVDVLAVLDEMETEKPADDAPADDDADAGKGSGEGKGGKLFTKGKK